MTPDTLARLAAPVPRYTSYPTAPHFSEAVGIAQAKDWLTHLTPGASLSLYVHIPYCQTLCWYCGCNTRATRRYAPVASYLDVLRREIATVAALVPTDHTVHHIHWGGGSPNILGADDVGKLAQTLKLDFTLAPHAEFAVEIDPRHCDGDRVTALAAAGVTRVSLGIQDFDDAVQVAINRIQSFALTQGVIADLRTAGVRGLNLDLVYGLPQQTEASFSRTLDRVLELAPDRLAIFGYAHLPSRITHQRLIDETTLPDTPTRYRLANMAAERFLDAGYVSIGIDHFAKPDDPLAKRDIYRNFQGYTTDSADALIGFGASAISKFPQGYVQNATAVSTYARLIEEQGLAGARGIALSEDDKLRAHVIEQLMCGFELRRSNLLDQFGSKASAVLAEADAVVAGDRDGLVEATGNGFRLTPRGRPFVRTICAQFDTYLGRGSARHSQGI